LETKLLRKAGKKEWPSATSATEHRGVSNITDERSSALKDYFFSDLFYERGRTAKYFNSLHSVTPGTSEKDDILTYLYTQELPPLFASYYYCTAKFCQSMCFLECRQVRFNSIFIPPL